MIKNAQVKIAGIAPTLMHNGQLADPMNEYARKMKAITSKRVKTDEDLLEKGRLEFLASLYLTDDTKEPCWPGQNIHAMIRAAAKREKRGRDVNSGVFVTGKFPLGYEGPRTATELVKNPAFIDYRGVGVNNSTVYRTRPIFKDWSLEFTVEFADDLVNADDLKRWIEIAGVYIGLSDFRPQFGRFTVEAFEVS